MHIALLGSVNSWYVRDLRRAAEARGHRVTPLAFRQLCGWIGGGGPAIEGTTQSAEQQEVNVAVERADALLVRTMPPGSLEQVVFRMDALHRLEAAGVQVLNPPRALETAVDKYLASARLEAAGLPVPPTAACETAERARDAFTRLGGDVVLKPLFGSEGRGITRLSDPELAERAFRMLERMGAVIYQQRFVPHEGFDLRALVLGDRVLAAMRRRSPSDWRTNVSRGAVAEAFTLNAAEQDMALRAARAVGAPLAGVDLLPGKDGQMYVIEVNAVPGWQALARVTAVDVADAIMHFLAQRRAGDESPSSSRPTGSLSSRGST